MIYLKRFNEDEICDQIIRHIQESINEGNIESIWQKTINKIKNFSEQGKRKVLTYLITSLLAISPVEKIDGLIHSSLGPLDAKIAMDVLHHKKEKHNNYKSIDNFKISEQGKQHIKKNESLKLKAYKLKDGKISIGWGHAENIDESKYKIGDSISEEDANLLFDKDISLIENGIKRIFNEWKNEGVDVKISQSMYDALVSIAYNTGLGGLRKSEALKYLKNKNYIKAGQLIKKLRVSKKFPGLVARRGQESKMFLTGVI